MKTNALRTIPFQVHIPDFEGTGIAETVTILVQSYRDPESGEDILTPESLDLIEKTQARLMGLMSCAELRQLRLRLNLTQQELSDLLQIGAKTYTRWESGRARPSRSLNLLLCALRDGALSLEYLRCRREGREWESMLHRRLAQSIVFHCSGQGKSGMLRQITGPLETVAVAWRHFVDSGAQSLVVVDRVPESRARRGQITHFTSPYSRWTSPTGD